MNKTQWILYDQFNTDFIAEDIHCVLFLHSQSLPKSPYGGLSLHTQSQDLEQKIATHFIDECTSSSDYTGTFLTCTKYLQGLKEYSKTSGCQEFVVMDSSEHHMGQRIREIQATLEKEGISLTILPNTQFLLSREEFSSKREKPPLMENFYRWMRKKTKLLMEGDTPQGGKRNYDKDNRGFDKNHQQATPWTSSEGNLFPVSRSEALDLLDYFIENQLDHFGRLEDAMYHQDDTVYHSLLSTSLNFGLLRPAEVLKRIEAADTAIQNKEGFIRQVLGWREFMYHRFWHYKDTIYTSNVLQHTRDLPYRFWNPEKSPLRMFCINNTLKQVKDTGYSHHITRLMVIGNFCLLMGYNPHHINQWFWEMYADAFEWVVTPNVLGMSQYADGGELASKPYVASANYINKMSNYCKQCYYDPKLKEGEKACPLNYLYRNFIDKHQKHFTRQPFVVSNLKKVDLHNIRTSAQQFIHSLSEGTTSTES